MTRAAARASDRKVALVTGAGSGIGRAIALGLARHGFAVAVAARTRHALEETARLASAAGGAPAEVECIVCDVANAEHAASLVDRTVARFGRLDAIVNCAGAAPRAAIAETTPKLLADTFAVNAFGPAAILARAWPVLERQGHGCLVNVSTMGTIDPFPGFFVYAASKSALDSFTRSVAKEGAGLGIRAYSVNPGAVETPMLRALFDVEALPAHRALSPEVVAETVVACVLGTHPAASGAVIAVPSP